MLPGPQVGPRRKCVRMQVRQFTQREIDNVESGDDAVRVLVQSVE